MKKTVKVQKSNDSLYVVIPKPLPKYLNIEKGDTVLLEAKEDGTLIIKK